MASKASLFVFGLLIICATIVIFTPKVVAGTKYEGIEEEEKEATDKSQGRVLLVGALVKLLPKIFRIYEVYDKANNVYKLVNWTSTQLYEHVDNQCFPYCRETTTTNPCECDVSTQNEPPQVTPTDQQCKNFQYHCCDWTWIGLNCEQCCKGPRPAILEGAPSPAPSLEP